MSEKLDFFPPDDADPVWEGAKQAVEAAWESAQLDDVRGVIYIYDRDEGRFVTECKDINDLRSVLSAVYDEAWYGYVPFDSGEAVFEGDSYGFVGDFLSDQGEVEEFFERLRVEESEEELFQSNEAIHRDSSAILQLDLAEIN